MPSIDIQVMEGVFSDEDKTLLIKKVTEAFGEVAGKTLQEGTTVRIHEVQSGSWSYAGKRPRLFSAHQAREAHNVNSECSSKPSPHGACSSVDGLSTRRAAIHAVDEGEMSGNGTKQPVCVVG